MENSYYLQGQFGDNFPGMTMNNSFNAHLSKSNNSLFDGFLDFHSIPHNVH